MEILREHDEKLPSSMATPSAFFPEFLREILDEFTDEVVKKGARLNDTINEAVKEKAATLPPTPSCRPESWKHLSHSDEDKEEGKGTPGTAKRIPHTPPTTGSRGTKRARSGSPSQQKDTTKYGLATIPEEFAGLGADPLPNASPVVDSHSLPIFREDGDSLLYQDPEGGPG
jgi:hypothetical protein